MTRCNFTSCPLGLMSGAGEKIRERLWVETRHRPIAGQTKLPTEKQTESGGGSVTFVDLADRWLWVLVI